MGKEQEQAVKQEPTSTETTSGNHYFAKLSTFYGEAGKGKVSFYTWKYEVWCLLEERVYREELILQGIWRSDPVRERLQTPWGVLVLKLVLKKYLRSLWAPMDI